MKEIPVPEAEEERLRLGRKLVRRRRIAGGATVAAGALAALLLIGTLVVLLVLEFRSNTPFAERLLYALTGGFAGGAVVCALLAVWFGQLTKSADLTERDYRERCDGAESFFVGEGTLATFEDGGLHIHSEDGSREDIFVPYGEMRFFSVCTRHAPREKGEWSIVFEIPVKYLAKKGKSKPGDPPALVQTDGKERLYACLERRGFALTGSLPPEKPENRKFVRLRKFVFPDRAARRRALALIVFGGVLLAAAVPVGLFLNVTAGALLGVFGAFLLGRSCASYAGAKSELAFYREGIFWREKNRADSVFLKWEDIVRVTPSEKDGYAMLDVTCPYGVYHYPDPDGAEEFLRENFPDKIA